MIPEQSSEPHVNHAVDSQVSQVNGPTAPEDATMQVQDSVVPPDVAGVGKVDGNHAVTESTNEDNETNWDPLQSQGPVNTLKSDLLEGIEEENRMTNSDAGLEGRVEPPSSASRRASQHRLELKLSSPPPWEFIDPPNDDDVRKDMNGPSMNTRTLIPKSSYYHGPPTGDAAYGTAPIGHIGIHHPREILRVERDYTGGEVIQFSPSYPLELEGRITPTQFLESINLINEVLISAHSLRHSLLENVLAVFTLQLSRLTQISHYEKEMRRLRRMIDDLNGDLYNPVGLNILSPESVAFLFLEIEYY
jgi:hypothetical protein